MTRNIKQLFGIEIPVMLGAFGGLSSVGLTGLVSERGGLGSYGLYGYTADQISDTHEQLRQITSRPFAVNLWLPRADDAVPEDTETEFRAARASMESFFVELGLARPERPDRYLPGFEEQMEAVLESRPGVLSFVYGVPPAELIDDAHRAGIVVVGSATTVDEAVALENGGVDAVVASGAEAAGHRVSFLRPAAESLVGTFALVPQIVDAVRVPVIAAGGVADRRGVSAAIALGASGVQVGTAFLRTRQSAATNAHRDAITHTAAHETVLTRAMSGRLARGIPNRATRHLDGAAVIAPFPAQNWLTGRFRAEAARRNLGELQSLWAGQASPLARFEDADDVFTELARGVPSTQD